MQLVVFSHGNMVNRFTYSALYRELASCGYFVVTITHGDGSADYHPKKGPFPGGQDPYKYEFANYEKRNKEVKYREKEVL